MADMTPGQRSALATVRSARASRRTILKSAAGAGALGLLGPAFMRKAFSSSGELNWFTWKDYAPPPLLDRFELDTGIKINVTSYSSNEDALNKLKASGGVGWDMASPSIGWVSAHVDSNNLAAIDESKLPNLSKVTPSLLERAAALGARRDGKLYALPYDWGTEALAYNTDKVQLEYGEASFGDLWKPEYKGLMLCRPPSIMLATGLWMERDGKLPEGTMRKAYDDEAAFDLGYGTAADYVVANKAQIQSWWKDAADTQSGFEQHGAVIGETWDGPVFQLKNQGLAYNYLAPAEGALTWIDSIAVTARAQNVEQAYAFVNWSFQPEIDAIVSDNTGYNSVVQGFDAHVTGTFRKNFADAYPGDAISRLWVQGTERPWFLEKRQALVDRISAA